MLSAYPAGLGQYYSETGSLVGSQPHLIAADQQTDQVPGLLGHVALHSNAAGDNSGEFTSTDNNIDLKRGTQFQIAIAPEGSESKQTNGAE